MCAKANTRNLPGNLAQMHRTTFVNPDNQPDKIAYLGNPLIRSQYTNLLNPGMIECVDRHWVTPFLKWSFETYFSGEPVPINLSFVKVSGD